MAMMDVFSEQGGTPATPSVIQSERFVWDSTIDGPIVSPTGYVSLGTFGTAGKTIGSIRGRLLTDSLAPNFTGLPGSGIIAISNQPLNHIWFFYTDDNANDLLLNDGWQVPVSANDNAQVDTYQIGTGPIDVGIFVDKIFETWNLTGRIEFVIEWVESE